ncbi:unnamed protein product [Boreogadus saida]
MNHLTPWEESRGPGRDKGFQDLSPSFSGRSSPPQLPLLVHLASISLVTSPPTSPALSYSSCSHPWASLLLSQMLFPWDGCCIRVLGSRLSILISVASLSTLWLSSDRYGSLLSSPVFVSRSFDAKTQ